MCIRLAFCALLVTAFTTIVAAEPCPDRSGASPAQLKDTDRQKKLVAGLSHSWSSDESVRLVRFGAYVESNGKMFGACCISSLHAMGRSERQALSWKLRKLRFSPASHNGETFRVYVGFTLLTQKTETGVKSTLLMNQQNSIDDYGIQYVAPQRINNSQKGFFGLRHPLPLSAELGVQIDRSGMASNARIIHWTEGQEKSKEKFLAKLNEQCFIPGFHKGHAVEMVYHEVFQTPTISAN